MYTSLSSPADLVRLLVQHPRRWLVPAGAVVAMVLAYAVLRPERWEATQALMIRNEATGNADGPGKFRHSDEMKALLETVLELAKSRGVLLDALKEVGPSATYADPSAWPTDEDIDSFRDACKIVPPKGAEFGKTEVFYIKVVNSDRSRALALAAAVCDQLEARYNKVRDRRAQSMVDELTKSAQLAEADAEAATQRIKELEHLVGGDLAELRNLEESHSGESDLRRKSLELESELRQAQSSERTLNELLKILSASQADQGQLLATPNGLLESQPALRRLKDGLLDAQIRTAQLLGSMSPAHPQVGAARAAEIEIQQHLRNELKASIRGVELDWRLATTRVETLEKQLQGLRDRLERLSGLRAEYSRLLADSAHRTRLMEEARRQLVEARGAQSGAHTASLLTRLDAPTTGPRPVGPSRTLIALAGLVAGPIIGVGCLVLSIVPLPPGEPVSTEPAPGPRHGLSLKQMVGPWPEERPTPKVPR